MHKVIIFDCGNVLFTFSREHLLDVFVSSDEDIRKLFTSVVFDNWHMQDIGMPSKDYYELVKSKLPISLHEAAYNVIFHWDDEIKINYDMENVIIKLKKEGHTLVLLSDMPETFTYHHEKLDMLKHFDDLIFSFPIKVAKPSEEIYQYLLDRHHVKGEDCIFIDDREDNLEGARKLSIDTYLYSADEYEKFKKYILETECKDK